MTKRTIVTGVGSYVDKRGVPTWGYRGQEVDVNDDYLDEFDAMNVEVGDGQPVEYERVGVDVVSPKAVEIDRKAEEEAAKADESSTTKKTATKKA